MKLKKFVQLYLAAAVFLLAQVTYAAPGGAAAPSRPSPSSKASAARPESEQKWQTVLAGARKEGTVRLYGLIGASVRAELLATLKEKFGVNLELVSGASGELMQKLIMEQQANVPSADLYIGSPEDHMYLKPKGYLVPLTQHIILPETKEVKNWVGGKFPMFDKDGTAVALLAGYSAYIMINTQIIAENEIHGYEDLLKPQYKGKMVMFDPTTSGGSPSRTFVNYVIPRIMGSEAGAKYLRELARQDLAFTRDAGLHVEWVAKGKYPIGIAARPAVINDFIAAGSPLTRVRPKKGAGVAVSASCLSIVKNAPHPNAATLFLNWALTDEGQRIIAKGINYPPRRLGVPFESNDQFAVVRPGEEITYETDEAFYLDGAKTVHLAKDIFGPFVGK